MNEPGKPTISVIIPVYNSAAYLSQCLSSVAGQSYTALDIVIIDDGSTDGSAAICDDWAKSDPRVRVFHQRNGGVASARNAGLRHAEGDLIGWVDSDDTIDADYFANLERQMQEHNASLVFGVKGHGSPTLLEGDAVLKSNLLCECSTYLWSTLAKAECYQGKTFRPYKIREDALLITELCMDAPRALVIKGSGYHYRTDNDGSLTAHIHDLQPWIDSVTAEYDEVAEAVPRAKRYASYRVMHEACILYFAATSMTEGDNAERLRWYGRIAPLMQAHLPRVPWFGIGGKRFREMLVCAKCLLTMRVHLVKQR